MSNARSPDPLGFSAAQPSRVMLEQGSAWRKGPVGGLLTRLPVSGEPALILMKADLRGRSIAIPQSRLHLYVDEKAGMPTPRLAAKAREVALLVGIDPLDVNITAIMDMVMFQAPELLKMKRAQ